jgi:hypothetical protein
VNVQLSHRAQPPPGPRRSTGATRRLRRLVALTVALLLVLPAAVGSAAPPDDVPGSSNRDREVTVMSRNLYLGADLLPLLAVSGSTPEEVFQSILAAVRTVWEQVQATDFPRRAEALAEEIVEAEPLLVGLQEVTAYHRGDFLDPAPAEEPILDFLEVLLAELADRGAPYRVIASVENFDGELPYANEEFTEAYDLRLTDRDVIIARADVPTSQLKVLDTDGGNFDAALGLPIGGVATPILRGWVSADVKHRGQTFRFVNTHPEAFSPEVNTEQVTELIAGPLATSLPVVLVGDLNATPDPTERSPSTSLPLLREAGFVDTAVSAVDNDPGDTCCFHPDLTTGELYQRIDYVLYRGGFEASRQYRVGLAPDQPVDGLYPSDHAGVVADLVLPPALSAPGLARGGRG